MNLNEYLISGFIGKQPFSRYVFANSPMKALKFLFPHAMFKPIKQCGRWSSEIDYCVMVSGYRTQVYDLAHGSLYPNVLASSALDTLPPHRGAYNKDLCGKTHESLQILECVDYNYICSSQNICFRETTKLYKCICHLCGKEYFFAGPELSVYPPSGYGIHAYHGYWSPAHCNCHPISSFQWTVIDILEKHGVSYEAEVELDGLLGLRFDFRIKKLDGNFCLLECQGEQHYIAVDKFGGESSFNVQVYNDNRKRKFCKENNIQLIEIKRVPRKLYHHIEVNLLSEGIISYIENEENCDEQSKNKS